VSYPPRRDVPRKCLSRLQWLLQFPSGLNKWSKYKGLSFFLSFLSSLEMIKFRHRCLTSSFYGNLDYGMFRSWLTFSLLPFVSWPACLQTLIYFADSFGEEFLIVDFFPEHTESFVSDFDSRCSVIDQPAVGVALEHACNCWGTILP